MVEPKKVVVYLFLIFYKPNTPADRAEKLKNSSIFTVWFDINFAKIHKRYNSEAIES